MLDFAQVVKQRHGLPAGTPMRDTATAATDIGDSTLFQALSASGFVGCIETNEQLATIYKKQIDFSAKSRTGR